MAGNALIIAGEECLNIKQQPILKFAIHFVQRIDDLAIKGYHLKSAKVNFILFWKKDNTDMEIKIVLPRLFFERRIEPAK